MSHWLPKSTLQGERAALPFVTVVAEWSTAWFPARGWRAASAFQGAADSGDWSVLREDSLCSLAGRPRASNDLAFAVLGQRPRTDLTAADQQLLRRIAAVALDDLHKRLEALFPASLRQAAVAGTRGRMRLTIGADNQPKLAVEIDLATLTSLVKAGFRAIRPRADMVQPRVAVAHERLQFEAHLGSARLSIGQIDTLEAGDIIVLDRPPDAPARISINDRLGPMSFALGDDGQNIILTLQD